MYTQILIALSLAAFSSASPVPDADLGASTTIVDVPSSVTYSALIMANPSSSPTTANQETETYYTPSNVDLPHASATLSLNGDLPSLSAAPSLLGSSETGGVRVVGQMQEQGFGHASAGSSSTSAPFGETAVEGGDQSNSAERGLRGGKVWMSGMTLVMAAIVGAML